MTYEIHYTPSASRTIKKWKKSNKALYKKFETLLHELIEHPRTGTGHPEPLVGGRDITYSRRITAHDRIIYDVLDNVVTVLVLQLESHYDDK